jgi:hypothetical protein
MAAVTKNLKNHVKFGSYWPSGFRRNYEKLADERHTKNYTLCMVAKVHPDFRLDKKK